MWNDEIIPSIYVSNNGHGVWVLHKLQEQHNKFINDSKNDISYYKLFKRNYL